MRQLAYQPVVLSSAGFATTAPGKDDVRRGWHRQATLPETSPALVLWVDGYWVEAGDRVTFRLIGPDGRPVVEHAVAIDESRAALVRLRRRQTAGRALAAGPLFRRGYARTAGRRPARALRDRARGGAALTRLTAEASARLSRAPGAVRVSLKPDAEVAPEQPLQRTDVIGVEPLSQRGTKRRGQALTAAQVGAAQPVLQPRQVVGGGRV